MYFKNFKEKVLVVITISIVCFAFCQRFATSAEFEELFIILEQNFTDQNSEIVILAKGEEEGLRRLHVFGPDGKRIIQLFAKNKTLGTREFVIESPEPDLDDILAAYPEGNYRFVGVTISGEKLEGNATLSHNLTEPAVITIDKNLGIITWEEIEDAEAYQFEFAQEEEGEALFEVSAEFSADTTSFVIPESMRNPGDYKVGVASVAENGNIILVEQEFVIEDYEPIINPEDFVDIVDNQYFPLTPGATYKYMGETEDGMEEIVVTVTDDTKEILGVTCTVVRDTVTVDGELAEDTFDYYAQDKLGNVWYFGEETFEFEDGVAINSAGAWEAGVDGAQPGIIMEADPKLADSYRQEFLEGEAEDMADVVSLGVAVEIPFGSFSNCLQTFDWTPLDPEALEYKFYASGVGLVKEFNLANGETLELVEISTE